MVMASLIPDDIPAKTRAMTYRTRPRSPTSPDHVGWRSRGGLMEVLVNKVGDNGDDVDVDVR